MHGGVSVTLKETLIMVPDIFFPSKPAAAK